MNAHATAGRARAQLGLAAATSRRALRALGTAAAAAAAVRAALVVRHLRSTAPVVLRGI